MNRSHSFSDVVRHDTKVLVLGTLPGAESLKQREYYANKRNQFWRFMDDVVGRSISGADYQQKLTALLNAGIGLGDTVASATRRSSLDADIKAQVMSDLGSLVARLPRLSAIGFNGATASRYGRKLLAGHSNLVLIDLPSSSPAYARMRFDEKLAIWRQLRNYLD